MPTIAVFGEPLLDEPPLERCAFPPPLERELDAREPPDEDELRPRDDAADDFRLAALALPRLLCERDVLLLPLLLPLLLREEPLLFGLEPFELRDEVFCLLWDREPAWAMSPP
jgi:hypothetical protein